MNDKEAERPMTIVRLLELFALIFSVITGLLTTSLVVFKGGALVQQVDQMDARVSNIEARGSPPIREHEKLDEERYARNRADIERMENVVIKYADMGAQIQLLNLKIEMLVNEKQRNGTIK